MEFGCKGVVCGKGLLLVVKVQQAVSKCKNDNGQHVPHCGLKVIDCPGGFEEFLVVDAFEDLIIAHTIATHPLLPEQ